MKQIPKLAYSTQWGKAYRGDSRHIEAAKCLKPGSVDLIFTSPPFALTRPKDYGNESSKFYSQWFRAFIPIWKRLLAKHGSLVVDLGGAYLPGAPRRSTYHFEVAVMLAQHFQLCQEFYWYNPAKLPSPAQWTNVERVRVKDSVNLVLWLAKNSSCTKADNRRVLKRYSDSMRSLLKNGYQIRKRPSNHEISAKFMIDNRGAIPSNLLGFASGNHLRDLEGEPFDALFDNILAISNTASKDRYLSACREHGLKPHGARFPKGLPAFFVEFLTEPGDLIYDPFAGSNTTGEVAEALHRRWVACELDVEGSQAGTYVRTSAFRFENVKFRRGFDKLPVEQWTTQGIRVHPAHAKSSETQPDAA